MSNQAQKDQAMDRIFAEMGANGVGIAELIAYVCRKVAPRAIAKSTRTPTAYFKHIVARRVEQLQKEAGDE